MRTTSFCRFCSQLDCYSDSFQNIVEKLDLTTGKEQWKSGLILILGTG